MITLTVKIFSSIGDRGTGLIGKSKPISILFLTRFGIHTFGLKFPIDVVVLDQKNIVVKLTENLKPNHFFIWPIKFNKVLELPVGTIRSKKIKVGKKIKLNIL